MANYQRCFLDCNFNEFQKGTGWLEKPTSKAQMEIEHYLYLLNPINKKILVVGVGNGRFGLTYGLDESNTIDGITICEEEKENAIELYYDKVYLINKYNPDTFNIDKYDIIVDVNLKSYACCDKHFKEYIYNILHSLKLQGHLYSHKDGFTYDTTGVGFYEQKDDDYIKELGFNINYMDNILDIERIK